MNSEYTTPTSPGPAAAPAFTIEIKSRDAAGNIKDHTRLHPDGTEENLI